MNEYPVRNGYRDTAVWIYKDNRILNDNEKMEELITVNFILISI